MADGEKKSFFGSGAFKLIVVLFLLGWVLYGIIIYSMAPKMEHACEAWAEESGLSQGAEHGGHDVCHMVAAVPNELEAAQAELEEALEKNDTHKAAELNEEVARLTNARQHLGGKVKLAASMSPVVNMPLATAWSLPNFLILVTILWHFAKDPVNQNFKKQREELAKAMEEAAKARADAEALRREYEDKLAGLEQRIAALRDEMVKQGQAEKARLIGEARTQAQRIQNEAEFTVKQELVMAQYKLREEAARLAVKMAEQVIRQVITDDDRGRLLDEYLGKIQEQRS
ncbi:MAG TPA: ATP synthase F0 subunit B [bacterium]|nr:ATP synthase F0 subunit B [bacterium]